jgi:hypothetical protein
MEKMFISNVQAFQRNNRQFVNNKDYKQLKTNIMENKEIISEIISTYDNYISLLDVEINTLLGYAVPHGYTGNETEYKQGVELREKISELKKKIGEIDNDFNYDTLKAFYISAGYDEKLAHKCAFCECEKYIIKQNRLLKKSN